jgi:hypothetical protein
MAEANEDTRDVRTMDVLGTYCGGGGGGIPFVKYCNTVRGFRNYEITTNSTKHSLS